MKIQGKNIDIKPALAKLPADKQKILLNYFDTTSSEGGYIPANEVQQLLNDTGWTIVQLMNAFVPVAQLFARPPISNYQVGAVVQGATGSLYFGANLEFVGEALSFCVHAEQSSIAHAISHQEAGVGLLAISAAPCGYCRQFLYEIIGTNNSTPEINVIINTGSFTLTSLLPQAFGPGDLGVTTRLMETQNNNMVLSPPSGNFLVKAALAAANVSYSPYTSDFSGVALYTSFGQMYTGSYAHRWPGLYKYSCDKCYNQMSHESI